MDNQTSFLDKIIKEIDFLGNVTCKIEKEDKIKKKDDKEDYISQNIYILSPN